MKKFKMSIKQMNNNDVITTSGVCTSKNDHSFIKVNGDHDFGITTYKWDGSKWGEYFYKNQYAYNVSDYLAIGTNPDEDTWYIFTGSDWAKCEGSHDHICEK